MSLELDASSIVAKVDLKDFFLCGQPSNIADCVSRLIENDPELRSLVHRAIFFLLNNQYVISNTLDYTFKCISGSGIGLKISAVLANLYFYSVVEVTALGRVKGLIQWVRYHDDVLALYSSRAALKVALKDVKSLSCGIWRVVCEGVHSSGSQLCFLDLTIVVSHPKLTISASQTKAVTPLCPSSSHISHVHGAWPKAVAQRVLKLSGGDPSSLSTLSGRYRAKGAHAYTLGLLDSYAQNPKLLDKCKSDLIETSVNRTLMAPIVLRFHPLYRWAFSRALALVPPPAELGITVRASWRNSLPSVLGIVQKSRHQLCKRVYGREGSCFLFPDNLSNNYLHNYGANFLL